MMFLLAARLFLSTLPAWGATESQRPCARPTTYFYPRSPRGERPRKNKLSAPRIRFLSTLPAWGATKVWDDLFAQRRISIHAPRVGSDPEDVFVYFLMHISIHAPRVGSDALPPGGPGWNSYFYPRSPRGERHGNGLCNRGRCQFYPRSPRGERHAIIAPLLHDFVISIHAPRVGSDSKNRQK